MIFHKNRNCTLTLIILFTASIPVSAKDWLYSCWRKQAQPLKEGLLVLTYSETVNELDHNLVPWLTTAYSGKGTVWTSSKTFIKQDSLYNPGKQRTYTSKIQRNATTLLHQDYGEQKLTAVTPEMHLDYTFQSARYSPVVLLTYFRERGVQMAKESTADMAHYQTTINQTQVRLIIRKRDALLMQVILMSYDEMLGDVTTSLSYQDHRIKGKINYPTTIRIEKFNGKIQEKVTIQSADIRTDVPVLLVAPTGYSLQAKVKPNPQIHVERYRPNVYFLELKHTEDRVMVVEFTRFLLVAEAPLNSANGELIIREAQKIAPTKPIRYFVAGHHHPHYLGGVRPFVHRGATVLHGKGSGDYVRFLISARHTLRPDSLELNPKPLRTEEILESKTISDENFEMKIFYLGPQSTHTDDYLFYYFPTEKLLFEDDLALIPIDGAIDKASDRQASLYNAVKVLALDVTTVVQSWPVANYGIKTVIPFTDLEQSMNQ